MSNLTRWDPFRELMSVRNLMDRLMEYPSNRPSAWQAGDWDLAMDIAESEDAFVVKASLPGMNPDDLEITFNNNLLTIQGEVKEERSDEQQRWHLRERRYGKFSRSVSLPANI